MNQAHIKRCIEHCTRAIEGLRQDGTRPEAAMLLDDVRCMLLAKVQEPDAWDAALAMLVKEQKL